MESIVIISKCTEEESIQYSSQMFKGEALEWWNTLIEIKGWSNMYNLEWKTSKELVKQRFCPIHEVDQIQTKLWNHKVIGTNLKEYNTKFLEYCRLVPHLVTPEYNKVTKYIYGLPKEIRDHVRSHLPASIELAGYLMESMIRNKDEEKKMVVERKKENNGRQKFGRGREGSSVFNRPLCKNCGKKHDGKCLKPTSKVDVRKFDPYSTCNFCKRPGHKEEDCRKKLIVCFECGKKRHFSTECTKRKPAVGGASGSGARNEVKRGNARAFMLNTQKAGELPYVVTGMFPINNVYARVLFDSGANQSFIDYKFCSLLNEPLAKLSKQYEVETANGSLIKISEVLSYITLAGYEMPVLLLPMELAGFDIILGMDWLAVNQARILWDEKAIEILTPNNKMIRIAGDKESGKIEIISKIKASHCLGKGCLAFMAYVTKEPEPKKLEEVTIVAEFKEVFPDELPGIPPDREVEFRIDLVSGTALIAKSPYRLAPTEMKELEKQLDELLEKGFIRPILALPEGQDNFIVYCDASHTGMGCVLMQGKKTKLTKQEHLNEAQLNLNEEMANKYLAALKIINLTDEDIENLEDRADAVFGSWVNPSGGKRNKG
ncbi:uncharacterized protein LOC143603698 [Bidens hawaiensis]|uniref:uncharacterized protein LOC143603698 n=1 Tax=Bidens hawaiensis TaxID=980011 RepID=UPI00404A9FCE